MNRLPNSARRLASHQPFIKAVGALGTVLVLAVPVAVLPRAPGGFIEAAAMKHGRPIPVLAIRGIA